VRGLLRGPGYGVNQGCLEGAHVLRGVSAVAGIDCADGGVFALSPAISVGRRRAARGRRGCVRSWGALVVEGGHDEAFSPRSAVIVSPGPGGGSLTVRDRNLGGLAVLHAPGLIDVEEPSCASHGSALRLTNRIERTTRVGLRRGDRAHRRAGPHRRAEVRTAVTLLIRSRAATRCPTNGPNQRP